MRFIDHWNKGYPWNNAHLLTLIRKIWNCCTVSEIEIFNFTLSFVHIVPI